MAKVPKAPAATKERDSKGEHGGNRGGGRSKADQSPAKSSQAAGKDPTRGKGKR